MRIEPTVGLEDTTPVGVVMTREFQLSEQSRRDSYIQAAMQGLISAGLMETGYKDSPQAIARRAVRLADAVMQEADA